MVYFEFSNYGVGPKDLPATADNSSAVTYVAARRRQGSHDVFFRAVVLNPHAHFVLGSDPEQGNAGTVKLRAETKLRIYTQVHIIRWVHSLLCHKTTPVLVWLSDWQKIQGRCIHFLRGDPAGFFNCLINCRCTVKFYTADGKREKGMPECAY